MFNGSFVSLTSNSTSFTKAKHNRNKIDKQNEKLEDFFCGHILFVPWKIDEMHKNVRNLKQTVNICCERTTQETLYILN